MEQLSIVSFIKQGHEYHLYVYEDIGAVPQGTVLKDANEIVSRERVFRDRAFGSYATFANVFRYSLLLKKGGFWADLDVVCLRPFIFESPYLFAQERIDASTLGLNANVIKTPAGSGIIEFCYVNSLKKASADIEWGSIGTQLITEAVERFELSGYVRSYEVFNPIDWWNWRDIISGGLGARIKIKARIRRQAHAVHFWNQMWTWSGINKDGVYHPQSLYEKLKRQYLACY
jgi:hypothetical protein